MHISVWQCVRLLFSLVLRKGVGVRVFSGLLCRFVCVFGVFQSTFKCLVACFEVLVLVPFLVCYW